MAHHGAVDTALDEVTERGQLDVLDLVVATCDGRQGEV